MLAKLKYIRQEDKALQEIETKLRAQLNRLKQEESALRRQMRTPHRESFAEAGPAVPHPEEGQEELPTGVDDDQGINKEPLIDLNEAATSILQMCQAQYVEERIPIEEEEEEEEDEEEDGDDAVKMTDGRFEENFSDFVGDELGAEYQRLFSEMRAEVDFEDDLDDT